MKQEKVIITVPKPCSEEWADMSVADKGRHCALYQKTVIDFSILTDRQIIDIFKKSSDQACGRFQPGQLGRELVMPQKQVFSFVLLKRLAAGLLFFQSVANTAWAQTVKPGMQQEQKKPPAKADKKRGISGSVKDYISNMPLAGMMVQIIGTDIKTYTGKKGDFYIPLPDSFTHVKFTVAACYSEHSGEPLVGTMIMSEEVYTDSLPQQITIYTYPVDILDAEEIKATKYVRIDRDMGMTNVIIKEDIKPVKKHRRWLFFRSKKEGNE